MGALTVHNIAFRYDSSHPVLRNLSLAIQRGEFLSLAGPNGSGKSTLLRLLDRILIPDEGEIRLFDRPLASFARADLARTIAFVPQDSGITFPFSVLETVLMGRSPHSRGSMFENAGDRAIALDMMRLLDIGHLAEHPVTALSGGERQRVFIARALAQKPEVLLLDEPNAHLDIAHQLEVFRILRTLNRHSGLTVVSVSHDLNLASAFSDRIALLRCGSIAAVGTPGDVMTEQLLFDVFRTGVMVDQHPVDGTARVTLVTSVQ